jgi:hypothetical protein
MNRMDAINIQVLDKGRERYIYLYDDANIGNMLRKIGMDAANPQLSLSWLDACRLSIKVRYTEAKECEGK